MHVQEEGLRAPVRLERDRIRHQRQHRCGVDARERGGLASNQAVEAHCLCSDLMTEAPADPGPRSLQGQRAVVQLVLEFSSFVVDPVILDYWSNQTQPAQNGKFNSCDGALMRDVCKLGS